MTHRSFLLGAGTRLVALVLAAAGVLATADFAKADVLADANEAVLAHKDGDHDKALNLYSRVINSGKLPDGDPVLTYVLNNRGQILFERGEDIKAMTDFNHAANAKPDHTVFYNRGLLYMERGYLAESEADFSRALAIHPKHAKSLLARSQVFQKMGDNQKSRVDLNAAKALDPNIETP